MFYFNSFQESPFKDILNTHPKNHNDMIEGIEFLFDKGMFSETLNEFLTLIVKGEPIVSLSTSAFDTNTTIMEWRLARSSIAAGILKVVTGSPHKEREIFHLYPNDMVMYFYGHGECEAIVYEFEEIENYDIFITERRMVKEERITLKSGDSLALKAGVHGFRMLNVYDLAIFEVSSYEHHNIVWNFCVTTKKMLHPSAADVSSTRLIMAMEVLKSIGNNESIELISNIAKEHHQHYIRWGAIEAIACLDENRTKQLLNNALIDSHPEVRIAAIKTLEMNGVS